MTRLPPAALVLAALVVLLLALPQSGGASPFTGTPPETQAGQPPAHNERADTARHGGSPFGAGPAPKAAQSPFTGAGQRESAASPAPPASPGGSLFGGLTSRLAPIQQEMNRTLSRLAREIREQPGGRAFWLFLALSGAYGVLHALGPGHGKTLVASYFLGRKRRGGYLQGLLVSMAASGAHVASAVILVLAASALLRPLSGSLDQTGRLLTRLGGGLLAAVGLVMAARAVWALRAGKARAHAAHAADDPAAAPRDLRAGIGIAVASGAAPCPVAAMVLAFSLSTGIPRAGSVAMAAMTGGMGVTTWLFAVAAIACRDSVTRLCEGPALHRATGLLSVSGGLLLSFFGSLMLLA